MDFQQSVQQTMFGHRFLPSFVDSHPLLKVALIHFPIILAPALFAWLLPGLLRYRRGGMAILGLSFSLLMAKLVPMQLVSKHFAEWYPKIHPGIYVIFFLFSIVGIALCGVGIYDRKRSAIWGMIAVLALTGSALMDSLVWLGAFRTRAMVPYGFMVFVACLLIGFIRRRADPDAAEDLRIAAERLANNRTRKSNSISRKLLREGNVHLFPLYYFLSLSTLGREGIENSGSYYFADHIYKMQPSGRGPLGLWIDKKILSMPATKAFRERYKRSQEELIKALKRNSDSQPFNVLIVPAGVPREIKEVSETLLREAPELHNRLRYFGMDIDPKLLSIAESFLADTPLPHKSFTQGNALLKETYPDVTPNFVSSTGLGEFLKEPELLTFFSNIYEKLAPGGTFYTSATREEKRTEKFMSAFELITQYRKTSDLERILRQLPWTSLTLVQDDTGYQTFAVAVK